MSSSTPNGLMCEMSTARNNGLMSAEKETCGMRSPSAFDQLRSEIADASCAGPAGSCGQNAGQPRLRSSVDALVPSLGLFKKFSLPIRARELSKLYAATFSDAAASELEVIVP